MPEQTSKGRKLLTEKRKRGAERQKKCRDSKKQKIENLSPLPNPQNSPFGSRTIVCPHKKYA